MHSIQSTVDSGRLHLSYEGLYIDSINSYNNWFTQFFAWIGRRSMRVSFNGKVRSLNKVDYAKWISSHTDQINITKDTVGKFADFCKLQVRPPSDVASPTRFRISKAKSERLYHKLVSSMCEKRDYEKAQKYVAKGADLDKLFWTRDRFGVSFSTMKADLPDRKIQTLMARKYTPFLYAKQNGPDALANLMVRAQADTASYGEVVEFSRELVDVSRNSTLEPTIGYGRSDIYTPRRHFVTYGPQAHVDMRTSLIATYQDSETKRSDLFYNRQLNITQNRPVDDVKTFVTTYTRVVDSHRLRLV